MDAGKFYKKVDVKDGIAQEWVKVRDGEVTVVSPEEIYPYAIDLYCMPGADYKMVEIDEEEFEGILAVTLIQMGLSYHSAPVNAIEKMWGLTCEFFPEHETEIDQVESWLKWIKGDRELGRPVVFKGLPHLYEYLCEQHHIERCHLSTSDTAASVTLDGVEYIWEQDTHDGQWYLDRSHLSESDIEIL